MSIMQSFECMMEINHRSYSIGCNSPRRLGRLSLIDLPVRFVNERSDVRSGGSGLRFLPKNAFFIITCMKSQLLEHDYSLSPLS